MRRERRDARAAVTFDVDWAPDWAIAMCRDLCAEAGVPATFFVTHDSPVTRELMNDPRFEVGIHPNFLPGSSHGGDLRSVLDFSLRLVPGARAMRTHALYQSTQLFRLIADAYPQVTVDCSLFLPFERDVRPLHYHVGETGAGLLRLPFYFEDDLAAEWPGFRWDAEIPPAEGLKIFDFHPMYVALNVLDMAPYRRLKASLGARRLHDVTRAEVAPLVHRGAGDRDFLMRVLSRRGDEVFATISEIAADHRAGGHDG